MADKTSTTIDHSHHGSTVDPDHANHTDHTDHTTHTMSMFFHTNIGTDYVLFENWKPDKTGDMVWTCLVIFLLGVVYEGLKYYREYLMKTWRVTNTNKKFKRENTGPQNKSQILKQVFSCPHFSQTVLHLLQYFISYVLMLIFMTYNVYFCISVLIGAGVGYFLFGWNKSTAVEITEHCH